MQTFLPYPGMMASAQSLDYKRLGKQRVEAKQLLLALGVPVGAHRPRKNAWSNHPAARMWRGHEYWLVLYGIEICREWRRRGYNDTLLSQFELLEATPSIRADQTPPKWWGDFAFHRSHKSNLIRKDWDYYHPKWPDVPDNLEYVWPV